LPEFLRRTAPWKHQIAVHQEDLNVAQWDKTPIEFLFIDAMKSPQLGNAIARAFFPYLIPDNSYVAHQDFIHFFTSWIHLLQFQLRNCFEFVSEVSKSSTVIFRCLRAPIAPELDSLSLISPRPDEIEAAFAYSLGLVSEEAKPDLMAAKAMAYIHIRDFDRAGEILGTTVGDPRSKRKELEAARAILEQHLP